MLIYPHATADAEEAREEEEYLYIYHQYLLRVCASASVTEATGNAILRIRFNIDGVGTSTPNFFIYQKLYVTRHRSKRMLPSRYSCTRIAVVMSWNYEYTNALQSSHERR